MALKARKLASFFRPQSLLTRSGLKIKQNMGTLKHDLGEPMIDCVLSTSGGVHPLNS